MAGIFGCAIHDKNWRADVICSVLQRHSLSGFLLQTEYKTFGNTLGLGYAARENSPDGHFFSSADARYTLIISGELFLPSGFQLTGSNFQNEFISLYEKKGIELFLECDGAFVLAIHDTLTQSIRLVTDPFGNLALYYANSIHGFVFSSQQKALAEVIGSAEVNAEAIAELLSFGQLLNGKTVHPNIHRIPPASVLTVDEAGKIQVLKYFSTHFAERATREENLRLIEESFLRSVEIRTKRSGVILGLSGGLDSRITLAALKKLGMTSTITTFTHGLADSGDVQLASRLSDKYHIPHLRMIFDDNFFESLPQYWRETVCVSEGALGIENALNVVSWKTESQSTISLDSHGGPLFRRQIFKSQEGYLRRSKDFIKTFFHLSASALLHSEFMNSELQEVGVKIGMRSLSEYFSSLPTDLTAGDKIDLYYLEQMCAHKYSQYGNAQLNYIGLSHPLLSLGTYIPITGIPSRERKRNIIYHYLFSRFAPELKHIRMDNSGYPVPYFGYRILRYIPPIYEKIVRKMPEYFYRFSLRKPVISHRMLVRKNFRELKEILLGTNAKTDSLFVSAKIEKALSDFETGKKDNYAELLQAANLKLLLEYFLQNP